MADEPSPKNHLNAAAMNGGQHGAKICRPSRAGFNDPRCGLDRPVPKDGQLMRCVPTHERPADVPRSRIHSRASFGHTLRPLLLPGTCREIPSRSFFLRLAYNFIAHQRQKLAHSTPLYSRTPCTRVTPSHPLPAFTPLTHPQCAGEASDSTRTSTSTSCPLTRRRSSGPSSIRRARASKSGRARRSASSS